MKEKEKRIGDTYPANLLKTAEKKSEKSFYWFVLVLCIVMFAGILTGKFDRGFPTPKNIVVAGWKQIQIQKGDTLWSIAKAYGETVDARLLIEIIRQKNGIDQVLPAGKPIFIPSAAKYKWDNKFSYPKNL